MKMTKVELGSYGTNCYILVDDETKQAAVVDPGLYNQSLLDAIEKSGAKSIKYILLTHGHFDHVLGAEELQLETGAKIAIHENDIELLYYFLREAKKEQGKELKADLPIQLKLHDGDSITFGGTTIETMHLPGHTKGGVAYIHEREMFIGDTVFHENIGRTDLAGGDYHTIMMSCRRLMDLDGDYTLYPGHGEKTTLQHEREYNTYFEKAREVKYAKPYDESTC